MKKIKSIDCVILASFSFLVLNMSHLNVEKVKRTRNKRKHMCMMMYGELKQLISILIHI